MGQSGRHGSPGRTGPPGPKGEKGFQGQKGTTIRSGELIIRRWNGIFGFCLVPGHNHGNIVYI